MKFSIVVPVYGVEKYLDECVESLLAQTYTDFEVILVDDCSPDQCPAMCERWQAQDERIRVIHKPINEGLGYARNTGMEVARGQYIFFVDSDDSISNNLLEICNAALTEQTDMLVFGVEYLYEDKNGHTTLTEQAAPERFAADTPSKRGELFAQLNQLGIFPFAWNKIYRKSFLDASGVLFEQTKLIEDFLFNIALFGCAGRIDAIEPILYHYRKPAHETLASKYSPDFFELCKRKYRMEEEFLYACGCADRKYCDLIRFGYLKHLVAAVLKNKSKAAQLSQKDQKEKMREMMNDPLTVEIMKEYVPSDPKYRIIRDAICHKQVSQLLFYCTVIEFVQRNLRTLYRKLLKR